MFDMDEIIGTCDLCEKISVIEKEIVEIETCIGGEEVEVEKRFCPGCSQLREV